MKSGKEQPQQIDRDGAKRRLARKILAVQMIDAADARIGSEQLVGELSDRHVHAAEYPTREEVAEGKK